MGVLEDRLAALEAQRATGVARTRHEGIGEVAYRTDAELAAAIADLRRQIAAAAASSAGYTTGSPIYLTGSKGL